MHFGIVAVKAEVAQLIDAFTACWPRQEPVDGASLSGLEALDAWMRATQRQLTASGRSAGHPGIDTVGFWQDGEWAVMFDPSYAQASDRRALAILSERFGQALSFVIETSGGCAFFDAYRQGRLLRRLQSIDGVITTEGERLPEEASLPGSRYYTDETGQLQRAFGLTPPANLPPRQPITAAAYVDGEALRTHQQAAGAAAAKRPWWRPW